MSEPLCGIARWFGLSLPFLPIFFAAVFTAVVLALQAVARMFESKNS